MPDLRLTLDGVSLLLDVSVTHPTMPSALSSHLSSRPLGAARRREYEKTHKYAELATMEGSTVIPLVLESTGALGEGFRQFIRRISSRVRDGEFAEASPLVVERFLINALAIALQRGNAAILREGTSQLDRPLSGDPSHLRHFHSRLSHAPSYVPYSFSTRSAFGGRMPRWWKQPEGR